MWPLNNEHRGSLYSVNKQNLFFNKLKHHFLLKEALDGRRATTANYWSTISHHLLSRTVFSFIIELDIKSN